MIINVKDPKKDKQVKEQNREDKVDESTIGQQVPQVLRPLSKGIKDIEPRNE